MASTFTPNIQLEEPARGDDVGTWDTPVNNNMTLIDKVVGSITTISLNNSPVVLNSAQYQSKELTFNSTLTGTVPITFPTSFTKSYEIQNLCTGSSAFTVVLGTTAAGGQVICCPPGEIIDVVNDGVNLKYKNLGRVGTYMDYACSSAPLWITGCSIPPYLTCDGTSFSSATYPALTTFLGTTTLPDPKGRARIALDAGAGRVSSAVSGVAGNTLFAGGGDQSLQSHSHANTLTDPGHSHTFFAVRATTAANILGSPANVTPNAPSTGVTGTSTTGITITNAAFGSGAAQNMPPVYVSGITMIRSA